ncbi:MAG: hypothetical protein LC634_03110 [Sphingomonadales bacterium]|nr:hypothetical protein [Sphingomonadales bacterium]
MKEEFGTQLESGALRFVRDLPGPIERVWAYLVDPGKRGEWFCGGTMGHAPGDEFTMAFDHDRLSHERLPEAHAEMRGGIKMPGRVAAIEPARLLAFEGIGEDAEVRFERR